MTKKEERAFIHGLYGGRCAYCGTEIQIQEMQVDHYLPLRRRKKNGLERDSVENKKPACRSCNHYKRGLLPENFRKVLKKLHLRLAELYHVRVARSYGLVKIKKFDGIFYFERVTGETRNVMKEVEVSSGAL
jgi:hypothetical protein